MLNMINASIAASADLTSKITIENLDLSFE